MCLLQAWKPGWWSGRDQLNSDRPRSLLRMKGACGWVMAGWLVLADGGVVHKAGLQVPHWRRWQEIWCLDCQVQPHGMLQKTPWPSCVNSASQISEWTKPACVQCCSTVGRATQPGCHLQSAACWLFPCAAPAAALKSSCYARPKLPAVVLGLGLAVPLLYHEDTATFEIVAVSS